MSAIQIIVIVCTIINLILLFTYGRKKTKREYLLAEKEKGTSFLLETNLSDDELVNLGNFIADFYGQTDANIKFITNSQDSQDLIN